MKTRVFFQIAAVLLTGALFLLVAKSERTAAQDQHRPAIEKKVPEYRRSIEDYRKAIKDAYRVDIANFKDRLKGGLPTASRSPTTI